MSGPDVWIVPVEDRHVDVDALPFSNEEGAVARARSLVPEDAEEVQLTLGMLTAGCVLYLSYGTEGDCVNVIKRTMDR